MKILSKEEFQLKRDMYTKFIEDGAVFIYPTDTIYGIGCDARNKSAVSKIRELKQRMEQPFSVIVPSKAWITDNCLTAPEIIEWVEKLPGPYTLLLNLEKKGVVAQNVNPTKREDSLGVRIPDNWFSGEVEYLGFPVITTSVNREGNEFMTSLEDMDPAFKGHVDFIVYEGEKAGNFSKLIDLRSEDIKIIERKYNR